MKRSKISIIVLTFCCLIIFSPLFTQVQASRSATADSHLVEVVDAYYIDDDIYSTISVYVQTQASTENYYVQITLINPDGVETSFILRIITNQEQLILDIVFYHYATVAGDYTIIATIISNNRWYANTDIMIFDPPSGGSEGDPYIGITVF